MLTLTPLWLERSVEDWEADPGQDAACDAALTVPLPPAAELILAELRVERAPEPVVVAGCV